MAESCAFRYDEANEWAEEEGSRWVVAWSVRRAETAEEGRLVGDVAPAKAAITPNGVATHGVCCTRVVDDDDDDGGSVFFCGGAGMGTRVGWLIGMMRGRGQRGCRDVKYTSSYWVMVVTTVGPRSYK